MTNTLPNEGIKYDGSALPKDAKIVKSDAGYGSRPEYGIMAELPDGTVIVGTHHTDRSGLLTDARQFPSRAYGFAAWNKRRTYMDGRSEYMLWPWTA